MLSTLKNTASLLRIASVLARHDALFVFEQLRTFPMIRRVSGILHRTPHPTNKRRGERLADALVELGPSFIKLGQVLSTRSDLIGDDMARDLALLQDRLEPFPTEIARAIIEAEFEKPLSSMFQSFENTPVAAASMAQVHFAVTVEGDEVAVKILRPDVEKRFRRDMALFEWLADVMERRLPDLRRLRPKEMVQTMRESVEMELDLRYEAAGAVELRANMEGQEGFYVPEIDWQRTSARVLTLERINGTAGNDVAAIKAKGHDLDKILTYAANAFFTQVFRDGFFHADMHPGNLFILDDGRIAVVDFGIMGRLDYANRVFLAQILRGFLTEDYRLIAKIHADLGIIPPHKSETQFAMACMAIGKPILGKSLSEISVARLLSQLFHMSETFEMRLQPQLLLLQKTMMLAEGIGRSLNPNINMWKMSEPMIMSWYKQNLSAPALALSRIEQTVQQLQRLPEVLEAFNDALHRVSEGKLVLDAATLSALGGNRRRTRFMSGVATLLAVVVIVLLWRFLA
jgi:ubiquinone biosynthesis protein